METVIIICLLIIIFLLMQDQAANKKRPLKGQVAEVKKKKKHQSIIGDVKRLNVRSEKNELVEKQSSDGKISAHIEDKNQQEKISPTQIPIKELDEFFADPIDLEAEEEEWKKYGIMEHTHLAQGVTFEEMNNVGELLRSDELSFVQNATAVTVVQKIHGTELFNLLENSVEGASKKIAELLQTSFSDSDIALPTDHHTKAQSEFDINQFI